MNSFESSTVNRSMRLVYDLHGINFVNSRSMDYINETLAIMDIYSRDVALHSIRVSNYSSEIGKSLKLSEKEIKLLWCASVLHDIGKTGVPVEILQKPARLTEVEYEIVKTHSRIGYDHVSKNMQFVNAAEIMLYHHERYDGTGYPAGKRGQDIPLLSRIISVADAFDAMTSERPYKVVYSMDIALTELKSGKWKQFDGDVVDCFTDLVEGRCFNPKELNLALGLY